MSEQVQKEGNEKIINFFAGLVAGVMSVTICNPLDTARTRLNVLNSPSHHNNQTRYNHFSHAMQTIWKQQGWRGFYSGYKTNVIAIPFFHSLYFPLYEYAKKQALAKKYSLFQSSLMATTLAGTICNIITNPIWVVRTRLMTQILHHKDFHYKSTNPFSVIKQMYHQEGLHTFYKGLGPSLLSVSNAIVYFNIYQHLKKRIEPDLTITSIFMASTVSKTIATALTYPIVVIRTAMFDFRGKQKSHLNNIVTHIRLKYGLFGFYAGLKPDLIRLIPSNAIIFIVYQTIKKYL